MPGALPVGNRAARLLWMSGRVAGFFNKKEGLILKADPGQRPGMG